MFITTQKPHNTTSKSTLANWIKLGLKLAGINIYIFSAHSTTGASTIATAQKVPIDTVTRTAGWSSECTFSMFYNRTVKNKT